MRLVTSRLAAVGSEVEVTVVPTVAVGASNAVDTDGVSEGKPAALEGSPAQAANPSAKTRNKPGRREVSFNSQPVER